MGATHVVITCFKFGDDRFRGLASAEGQILPFPIDFDGRPYNTLTLPCEHATDGRGQIRIQTSATFSILLIEKNALFLWYTIADTIRPPLTFPPPNENSYAYERCRYFGRCYYYYNCVL